MAMVKGTYEHEFILELPMIPDITYLILNYNPYGEKQAEEVLLQTVDSFYSRKSKNLTSKVYLLDQGSVVSHKNFLIGLQSKYKFSLLLSHKNMGLAGAINFIVSSSKSPVIGLITSDVIITTGMDEDLYNKVQIPEVYQVVPLTDKSDLIYQTVSPPEEYGSDDIVLPDKEEDEYIRCIGVEFNVMFWRKAIFDKIGFYDERWMAGYENIDFSLRCFLDGGCTAISNNSFIWHFHKMTYKNKSREDSYRGLTGDEGRSYAKKLWNTKWPDLTHFIDIYKPLDDKNIWDFPTLYEKFNRNTYLPYAQRY